MTNDQLTMYLLQRSQEGGEDFATIYNKVAMHLVNHYEIYSTVTYLLCAAVIYDLRDDPKIIGRKEKVDAKVNHRRGKAGRTGKKSEPATPTD